MGLAPRRFGIAAGEIDYGDAIDSNRSNTCYHSSEAHPEWQQRTSRAASVAYKNYSRIFCCGRAHIRIPISSQMLKRVHICVTKVLFTNQHMNQYNLVAFQA